MKRKTKAQREAEQIAALTHRVLDVYSGAVGQECPPDEPLGAEDLSRALPALRTMFEQQTEAEWVWQLHNLHRFETAEAAAKYLYAQGARA